MIDKNWKLQRYDRKDYSELVEFPVEIVGRDGVVRRYTFEDSIRLYQRRITFAPIRYRDVDLIAAEVSHCRSRIDQLRRSYFHRFGWGTPEGEPSAEMIFGEIAGELAAFICRVLRCTGRPEIRFERVTDEQDGVSTWYVTPQGSTNGMLLYVHRFDGTDVDHVREAFFASLKSLERMRRNEGDGERLLAFHHTVDCGFVLTGRGADVAAMIPSDEDTEPALEFAPTAWDHVLEIIRRGDYDGALCRCRELARSQPFHRNAYVAGAMLAISLGEHAEAESLALLGSRYFPEDGAMHYYLGLAQVRQERFEDADQSLRLAVRYDPEIVAARTLLVALLARMGRYREALSVARERRRKWTETRRGDADLDRITRWILERFAAIVASAVLLILGALGVLFGSIMGALPAIMGCVLLLGTWHVFQNRVDLIVRRQRLEEVPQGLRHLHRPSRSGPLVS